MTQAPTVTRVERMRGALEESIAVKEALLDGYLQQLCEAADRIVSVFRSGNKIVLFGNGGSAAEAQHVAAEFIGRFQMDRAPLPAIALSTDTSILTSIGNDVAFEMVFARQARALLQPGDLAVAISTSGNSMNVLLGVAAARAAGAYTLGLTGQDGGKLRESVDLCLCVPSRGTARVQEANLTIWHAICDIVEQDLFGS